MKYFVNYLENERLAEKTSDEEVGKNYYTSKRHSSMLENIIYHLTMHWL